jgi:hypothetical protein
MPTRRELLASFGDRRRGRAVSRVRLFHTTRWRVDREKHAGSPAGLSRAVEKRALLRRQDAGEPWLQFDKRDSVGEILQALRPPPRLVTAARSFACSVVRGSSWCTCMAMPPMMA